MIVQFFKFRKFKNILTEKMYGVIIAKIFYSKTVNNNTLLLDLQKTFNWNKAFSIILKCN
jgi:hypothetical protein